MVVILHSILDMVYRCTSGVFFAVHDPCLSVTMNEVHVVFNEEVERRFRVAEKRLHEHCQGLIELKDASQSPLQRNYLNHLVCSY
jgi:hypothetical protein